jgi:hypothetical protein
MAGLFYSKPLNIPHLGNLFPPSKKSEKKEKSPLENTGKAYIFVSSDIHPKILSIKNLSWTNYLEKPYLFNHKNRQHEIQSLHEEFYSFLFLVSSREINFQQHNL